MSAKLMKPTVNVSAKNPQMAVLGHILSLIAAAIMAIFGIIGLLNGFNINQIISILLAVFVVLVELDTVAIPFLKDPLVRGIVWIVIAVITGFLDPVGFVLLLGGIFYLVYHFK